MCVCVCVCDKKLQIHLSGLWGFIFFFRVLFNNAVCNAVLQKMPYYCQMLPGCMLLDVQTYLFFKWMAKSSLKLWASFHPFRCQPTDTKEAGLRLWLQLQVQLIARMLCCAGEFWWLEHGAFLSSIFFQVK